MVRNCCFPPGAESLKLLRDTEISGGSDSLQHFQLLHSISKKKEMAEAGYRLSKEKPMVASEMAGDALVQNGYPENTGNVEKTSCSPTCASNEKSLMGTEDFQKATKEKNREKG
ncbi:UNVERIFIED_CONTAM: hypothetical protein K2H54_060028 [Gekko kuhli]